MHADPEWYGQHTPMVSHVAARETSLQPRRAGSRRWLLAWAGLATITCATPSDRDPSMSVASHAQPSAAATSTETTSPEPLNADARPNSAPHSTKSGAAPSASQAAPSQPSPSKAPASQPKTPTSPSPEAPHPRLIQFIDVIATWDAALAKQLREVDLRGTAVGADLDVVHFLQHWLLVEVAIPALRLSRHDPELASVLRALEGVGPYSDAGHAHANLKMGPITPSACAACETEPSARCNASACQLARKRLGPAVYSAAGLNDQLSFDGHPRAMHDGVGYTDVVTLPEYLDAVVEAGIRREKVSQRVQRAFENVARRARHYGTDPSSASSDSVRAQLLDGVARWRATYAPQTSARSGWELPDGEATARALWEALNPVEASLLGRFKHSNMRRYLQQRRRFRSENAALERALAAGRQVPPQLPEQPSESDPCNLDQHWDESRDSCATLVDIVVAWEYVAQSLNGDVSSADDRPVGWKLAIVLERLTWAELSATRVDALLRTWERETKRSLSREIGPPP